MHHSERKSTPRKSAATIDGMEITQEKKVQIFTAESNLWGWKCMRKTELAYRVLIDQPKEINK